MRKTFTIFGDERELKIVEQLVEMQNQIKEERRRERESKGQLNQFPPIVLKACTKQEFAIIKQLEAIFNLCKEADTTALHSSLKELYFYVKNNIRE